MAWGKTTRLLLIWPETDEGFLNRRLDLLLLKRRAHELGSSLALVSRDAEIKSHARDLNLPVFRTVREAQNARWHTLREKSRLAIMRRLRALHGPKIIARPQRTLPSSAYMPRHSAQFLRFFVFSIAIFSVTALAAIIFPNATITLTPATQTQTLTFTAYTHPNLTTINASGAVPSQPITVIVEGRATVETTGSLTLPDAPATGRVTFTNLTDVTVIVPEGTIVQTTDLIRFATTQQVQVPAQAGGTVSAPIKAVQPGLTGNVEAETIQSIEGTLGLQLTVTNPSPTMGGTEQTVSAPTALDRRRAYRQLLDSLRETASTEILAQLAPGDLLLNTSPFLVRTLEETYLPAETVPSDLVEATLRLEFQSPVIRYTDLQALAQTVLDSSLPLGFDPLPDTLTFEMTVPQADSENHATWEMKTERQIVAILPTQDAVNLALGQSPALATSALTENLPLASSPTIELTPSWWPRLPFLPFQIEVQTQR